MVDPRLPNTSFLNVQTITEQRIRILSEFLHLPFKTYLFGDASLSGEENETIFDAVHKYIILTKSFDVN